MRTLYQTLQDADEATLTAAAMAWGVQPVPTHPPDIIKALGEVMLNAENAERIWQMLQEDQRQALQTVLGAGGTMPTAMFKRLFGDIRRMGRGAAERDQPHKNPTSPAEALFYRGLVAEAIQMGAVGSQGVIYVPEDLALLLPTHQTAYDGIEKDEPDALAAVDVTQLTEPRRADTSIVDDMTTLLAFLQLHAPPVAGDSLARESLQALAPYLLTPIEARVAFLMTVGVSAELIDVQDGRAYPRRADARGWLGASRSEQIEGLVRAWLGSTLYRELWHVPGLTVERAEGYDPTLARRLLQAALKNGVPPTDWWDVDEFIYAIKQSNPDFQRPNGDYDAWYITDMGEEYVRGFESWDTVEGALIEYLITGPMHWLGLLDVAPEAARLTAYGRGVVGLGAFPKVTDETEPVTVQADGTLLVSRKVPRIDRFQVARFTSWGQAPAPGTGDPFTYTLDAAGVRQADAQGINAGHITTFLKRMLDDAPIPDAIERVLRTHQMGESGNASITQMIVLRTTSEQVMDDIVNTPELRRYLGARLGAMACAVRDDQWEALRDALAGMGIGVDVG